MTPQFKAVGDQALLVSFAEVFSDEIHDRVMALDRAISQNPPVGMIEVVPALVNLLVSFDPCQTTHEAIATDFERYLTTLTLEKVTGTLRHVDVCYDASLAPDLEAVATATSLSQDAVINAHLAGEFSVLMYGFSPGYAYLSGVPNNIRVPRKPAAVRDVPAGSVIIADQQCLVTTLTMPTGWSRIGRSPTQILTGDPNHPFLFDVGDKIVFRRIDLAEFDRLSKAAHYV
ncbi:5-oxoprolinase subunit B family protein [Litoreibacter albidus]|uniref:Inhibitor of KinA n=1 Tax=Litoreibacter albidus TaxID=670155 RepID=A0A1H2V1H6_9RHOB|nr:allophanate hydrolase subunit 1 [Litoreibacter albidus]SDW62178.1 inhibitor of KinA [Litoreibacter albidus]